MDKLKEIKKYRTLKAKFRRQGNLKLVAEYANTIGNLCSDIGDYRLAIEEHECELSICQDMKDIEGEAIANRKLGECYIELVDLEPAKEHVTKFIDLARTLPKKVELQRAYVTMGRLCLVEIPTLIPSTAKRIQSEKKAENSFLKALDWCNKLKPTLESTEYQEMRARAILNLGLLADMKNEDKEALGNFKNASVVGRRHNLHKTYVTCLNYMAELEARLGNFEEARSALDDAMSHNQKFDTGHTVATTKLFAQVTVEMGDVGVGLDTVKSILRKLQSDEKEELTRVAIKLYKIIVAKRKVPVSNDEDKRHVFEKIGDYCCELGAYHHALLSYQKTLDIINQQKLKHEILTPILISMARTYQDLRDYGQAINFYCQEAKIQQQLSNFDQAARSLLNVANCMENGNNNIQMIYQCYKKAESHARSAGDHKLQLLVLKNFRDSMKSLDDIEKFDECCKKIERIQIEHGLPAESQEEESQNSDGDEGAESSDGGFELSDHSSDEERESEVVKSTRCRPFKIRRNELGETKLHQAVIKGKMDVVTDLLNKGHPVDIRDHAGWFPLHEAAIHNRVEIARILIEHGADLNDRAGKEGVTPLHDACSSGCCETLQFLMEAGASVIAKDSENKYPLDYLLDYLEHNYDELDDEKKQTFEDLESMLRSAMTRKGITPKAKTFKVMLQQKEDDVAAEMADIQPVTKLKGDDSIHSQPGEHIEVPLSPPVTATEMYKSAVANVRKSAKRVAPQCAKERVSHAEGPALLRDDCKANLIATGDWLIDDYKLQPATKKQKVVEPTSTNKRGTSTPKCTRSVSRQSTPSVIGETPEKAKESSGFLLDSPEPVSSPEKPTRPAQRKSFKSRRKMCLTTSDVCETNENAPQSTNLKPTSKGRGRSKDGNNTAVSTDKSESTDRLLDMDIDLSQHSPENPLPSTRNSRVRKRLPSLSPLQDVSSQLQSQPLTPAFAVPPHNSLDDQLTVTSPGRQPGKQCGNVNLELNASISELLDGPNVFEINLRPRMADSQPDGHDAETLTMPSSLSQGSLFSPEVVVKTNEENVDLPDKQRTVHSATDSVVEEREKNITGSPSSQQESGNGQRVGSPNLSEIYRTAPATLSKLINNKSGNPEKILLTEDTVVDSILGEPCLNMPSAGKNANSKVSSNMIPTSTPLRKQPALQGSNLVSPNTTSTNRFDAIHISSALALGNETKDSGFPVDPNMQFNTSLSAIRPSLHDVTNSSTAPASTLHLELNSSYYQHIRILVQWKNITHLIPIARCESHHIGWLCEELVRRLTTGGISEGIPTIDSTQIILTRATDGAVLHKMDVITSILVDNEKVVAVNLDDIKQKYNSI